MVTVRTAMCSVAARALSRHAGRSERSGDHGRFEEVVECGAGGFILPEAEVAEVFLDPLLGRPPKHACWRGPWERTHLLSGFMRALATRPSDVRPVSIGVFRGRLVYADLGLVLRTAIRLVPPLARRLPEGDFRDWSAIRQWTAQLGPVLLRDEQSGG